MSPTLLQLLLDLTAQGVRVEFARPSLDPSTFRARLSTFGELTSSADSVCFPLASLDHAADREALIVDTLRTRAAKLLVDAAAAEQRSQAARAAQ